jgi:hypothetical protein
MSLSPVREVVLTCHPSTRSNAVRSIGARVYQNPDGMLALTYILEGNLERLRLPVARAARFTDRLWEHTCCEIFIAHNDFPAYYEFNFSPSTEWAMYSFERYRERAAPAHTPNAEELNPRIVVRGGTNTLELDALIRLDLVSRIDTTLSIAISTVIEDQDGAISYWALKHPPGEPDFHHSDGFALEL